MTWDIVSNVARVEESRYNIRSKGGYGTTSFNFKFTASFGRRSQLDGTDEEDYENYNSNDEDDFLIKTKSLKMN